MLDTYFPENKLCVIQGVLCSLAARDKQTKTDRNKTHPPDFWISPNNRDFPYVLWLQREISKEKSMDFNFFSSPHPAIYPSAKELKVDSRHYTDPIHDL